MLEYAKVRLALWLSQLLCDHEKWRYIGEKEKRVCYACGKRQRKVWDVTNKGHGYIWKND